MIKKRKECVKTEPFTDWSISFERHYPFKLAYRYSRFIRAIFSSDIPLGHSTSHAPVLVKFQKPSSSI